METAAASAGIWPWLTVIMIGVLVGVGELISRYRDAPIDSIMSWPGLSYLALNAIVSAWVFSLANLFGWSFGVDTGSDPHKLAMMQVLTAGFGAMTLLRSAVFTVRVGSTDVAVGPAQVIQVLFQAIDREVDRLNAQRRADEIVEIMKGVDFDKAAQALPSFCFALMQDVGPDDQNAIADQVKELAASTMSPSIKSLTLGLALLNVVGADALREAVKTLGDEIRAPVAPPAQPAAAEPAPVPEVQAA